MTESERIRQEAERLFEQFQSGASEAVKESPTARDFGCICTELAYAAGRESLRAEQSNSHRYRKVLTQLEVERARSEKLLKWMKVAQDEGFSALASYLRQKNPDYSMVYDTSDVDPHDFANIWAKNLAQVIAEYEGKGNE